MSASGGNSALVPFIGALAIGAPAVVVMSLAFSDFNVQLNNSGSRSSDVAEPEQRTAAAPGGGFAGGLAGGHVGSSRPRLNLLGRAAPPAPRPAEEVDLSIEPPLLAEIPSEPSEPSQPAASNGAPPSTGRSFGAPVGQMAMLQGGGQPSGVIGGGAGAGFRSGGHGGGFAGFGGGPAGFSGGGAPGGGSPQTPPPSPQAFAPTTSANPAPTPPATPNLTPNPTPSPAPAPSAPPAVSPPVGIPPIVLGPGDVLKGNGPGAPVTNDGGKLAAGHSPGEMDLLEYVQNDGSTEVEIWDIGLRGVDYDYYDIAGDALFNGGTIEFVFADDFDFSESFDLEFLSAEDIVFGQEFGGFLYFGTEFDPLDFDDLFDVFVQFDQSGRERLILSFLAPLPPQQQTNAPALVAQATPEPEALLIFGLGLLGLLAARRRFA